MRTDKVLYQNKWITLTESTFFFPLCIVVGTPLIWTVIQYIGVSIPLWSNFCYFFFCEPNINTYKKRSLQLWKIIWSASIITSMAIIITPYNILRSIIAMIVYMVYKNTYTEKLSLFTFGYMLIAVLTGSTMMGVVNKDIPEALLQVLFVGFQTLIGFIFSLLFVYSYHFFKKKILGLLRYFYAKKI